MLAHNVPIETVVADATLINKLDETVALVSARLKIPAAELSEKLRSGRPYIVLKREVPEAEACSLRDELLAKNLRGIKLERDSQRIYPNRSMLCHVIGFTDFEHRGIQGVEMSMEDYLHGQDGYRYIERKPSGQEIVLYRGQEHAPRNGYDVHLTVDLNLQNIVENEIDAAMQEYHPLKGDDHSDAAADGRNSCHGESAELRSQPARESKTGADEKSRHHRHDGAGLDLQDRHCGCRLERSTRSDPTRRSSARTASGIMADVVLHDHKAYGDLTVQDVLVKSSNIGAAKLAMSVGEQKFYEYIRRFGFGDRTGDRIAGRNPRNGPFAAIWSKISITRIPMGHEIGVTPLQMTVAMATIANGGKLITPRIVKSITDSNGKTVSNFRRSFCDRSFRRRRATRSATPCAAS